MISAQQIVDTLHGLDRETARNTLAWVLFYIADGLPRTDSYPEKFRVFMWEFIANVLGADPEGDLAQIKEKIGAAQRRYPPDEGAVKRILSLMRASISKGGSAAFAEAAAQLLDNTWTRTAPDVSKANAGNALLSFRLAEMSSKES